MLEYHLLKKCRHVGMADDADSKSVVGNHVWVQVPLPALLKVLVISINIDILGLFCYLNLRKILFLKY